MGRTITKEGEKYKIVDVNEVLVEKKAIEDAIANLEKQQEAYKSTLANIAEELKKLRAAL